jgi:hypothetical protein
MVEDTNISIIIRGKNGTRIVKFHIILGLLFQIYFHIITYIRNKILSIFLCLFSRIQSSTADNIKE